MRGCFALPHFLTMQLPSEIPIRPGEQMGDNKEMSFLNEVQNYLGERKYKF